MQCPNCGKKNRVVINGKAYCADCGEVLSPKRKQAPHHTKAKNHNPKKSAPVVSHATRSGSSKRANVLDLSKTKAQNSHRLRPAHSVHGARKNELPKAVSVAKDNDNARPMQKHTARLSRAQNIKRSEKIQKFQSEHFTHYEKPHAMAVYKPKNETEMSPHQTYSLTQTEPQTHSRTLEKHPAVEDITEIQKETRQKKPSLIQRIAQAFAHPQFATIGAVAACVILLTGYVTYLNYPKLALRVATSRAGFNAQLPRYTPAGYGFSNQVAASPGQVVIRFNSRSDDTSIAFAQRQSTWDSATLLENYVKQKSNNYLTLQQNGLIIYIYDGNNAAWVNSGVFYTLEGNSRLSSDQIVKVATSL